GSGQDDHAGRRHHDPFRRLPAVGDDPGLPRPGAAGRARHRRRDRARPAAVAGGPPSPGVAAGNPVRRRRRAGPYGGRGRRPRPGGRPAAASQGRAGGAERYGWMAVLLTVLGLLLHAGSLAMRGAATDRVPWGNMYEFSSAVGVVAVTAFLVVLVRQPQVRHL